MPVLLVITFKITILLLTPQLHSCRHPNPPQYMQATFLNSVVSTCVTLRTPRHICHIFRTPLRATLITTFYTRITHPQVLHSVLVGGIESATAAIQREVLAVLQVGAEDAGEPEC